MDRKQATFEAFKDYTLAVARGERKVDPREPKVWAERIDEADTDTVPFRSQETRAKLL